MAEDGDAVVKSVVAKAKEGDMQAARLVLDRILPPRKGRPVQLDLPTLESPGDLVKAISDAVSSEDLVLLEKLLEGAYKVEMLHKGLKDRSERELNLAELDRARGAFAALVEAIKVSPISRII